MNQIIEHLLQHVSVREFTTDPVTDLQKQALLQAAQSGSTSEFIQAFSIIEITDKALRQQLSDITISSVHVQKAPTFYVFVADLNRQAQMLTAQNKSLAGLQNMESLLVAAVDTTIAAQNMAVAAESMGLGICYIGSLRNNIKQVAQLLHLPKYTCPLFGMTIGVPAVKNQPKPRLFLRNQVSENTYDATSFNDLTAYDQKIKDYYAHRKTHAQDVTWTEKNVAMFDHIRRPDVASFLLEQGFSLK